MKENHESNLLKCIKLDNRILDEIDLPAEAFTMKNQYIFSTMQKIFSKGDPINDLSLFDNGIKASDLIDGYTESSANWRFYYKNVREKHEKNVLRKMSLQTIDEIKTLELTEIKDRIEKELMGICVRNDNIVLVSEYFNKIVDEIQDIYNGEKKRHIFTGYENLDFQLCIENGDLVIVACRPSVGKTAFMLNLINNIGINFQKKVGVFSCEMNKSSIIKRLMCLIGRIDSQRIRQGSLRENDFSRMIDTGNKFSESYILIDDTPNIRFQELKSKARHMRRKGIQILFIDYLTLIKYREKGMSRWEAVGIISKGLKELARELEIPVICLSQLNREAEGKTPSLSHLRQSGEIEEDADIILFLNRKREERETQLIIAKNRNGPVGLIDFRFLKEYGIFEEA